MPALTDLCHLFLESEREPSASEGEGSCPVCNVFQPLDDEGGGDAERQIPDDVKVWWLCEGPYICVNIHFSHTHLGCFVNLIPSSHLDPMALRCPLGIRDPFCM